MSEHSAEKDAGTDEMGTPYLDRSVVLCRTCLSTLTWETRAEPGYLPRTGWYDEARSDPLVCFKARDYSHVPLTAREWAYYEAGQRSVTAEPSASIRSIPLSPEARERRARRLNDARPLPHEGTDS